MCEHWECPYKYCPYHNSYNPELLQQKREEGIYTDWLIETDPKTCMRYIDI